MAANPRHVQRHVQRHSSLLHSAAKILVQQAEQQMVLPDAVDAEIAPRQSLATETAFFQHPDRGRIGGNAGGLDPGAGKMRFQSRGTGAALSLHQRRLAGPFAVRPAARGFSRLSASAMSAFERAFERALGSVSY